MAGNLTNTTQSLITPNPPAAGAEVEAETSADIEQSEISGPEPEAGVRPAAEMSGGAWAEAEASMKADIDPEALTVMATAAANLAAADATFYDNLARARAGAERLAEQRAHDHAERDRAAVDEPVMQADAQAELEATAQAEADADQDADLEI